MSVQNAVTFTIQRKKNLAFHNTLKLADVKKRKRKKKKKRAKNEEKIK